MAAPPSIALDPPRPPRPPRSAIQHLGGHLRDAFIRVFPLEMRTASGLIVRLRNRSELELYRNFFVQQMYPLNEVASALAQTAEPVVFDVGANCGLFSALVFDRWRAARVHAFEPQKKLVAQIEEFAAINQLADRLSANWCAVSETQGEAQFHLNRNPIGSSLVREKVGGRRRRSVRVPLTTLDGYARQRGITRVDLVKLDVEGSELEALRGAQTILATAQALFAEFHPPHSRYRDAAPMLETFGLQPLRPCDDSAQSNCVFVRAR